MTRDQFESLVAGAPDLPASVANTPKAVEEYVVAVTGHAAKVEKEINAQEGSNTNYWRTSINEEDIYTGTVKVPVNLPPLTVA